MNASSQKTFDFPNGTQFIHNQETRQLTLRKLFGMTCGFNGEEEDDSRSGLALICVDSKRLEGSLLNYECTAKENQFQFSVTDCRKEIRLDAVWIFYPEYEIISCHYSLTNTSTEKITIRRVLPRLVFSAGDYEVYC